MKDSLHSYSLTRFAATAAGIMGIDPPTHADAPLDWVCSAARELLCGTAQRTVIYNPDAVAKWLYVKYRGMFEPVFRHTQLSLPFRAVMPSVTPVCFASMYTGVLPEVHGIRDKSIVPVDSLLDAAVRAGKRAAIVAVEDSSMSRIYLAKNIDYHILPYDAEVEEKALELVRSDACDLLCIYTQEYDDVMHRTGTESPEALRALQNQIDIFGQLAEAVKETGLRTALYFSPDHGVHDKPEGGGSHGSDAPEDLNIIHYLGLYPGKL